MNLKNKIQKIVKFIKDFYSDRVFDKDAFRVFLLITSAVLGGFGLIFLFVWLCTRHPQIVAVLGLSTVGILFLHTGFVLIFPKRLDKKILDAAKKL